MKKKTISVTVTYLLISKTCSSESQSWQSRRSDSVAWRAFSIPGSFVGKQGDLRGEREIGEATHADFFRAVRRRFFKNKKLSQQLYLCVFSPMMDIKLLFLIGI